jgi:Uma2 family endonuclease
MSTQPKTFLTEQAYLEIERKAEHKSEYYRGEMFAMAGGTPRHGLIILNVGGELRQQLKGKPCWVYTSEVRLRVSAAGLYTYPDAMVLCGERKYADDHQDTVTNPVLIIEVLSDSTRDYDLGGKFQLYRGLPSLGEYLTVEQDRPHVEQWTRQGNNWLLAEYSDPSQTIQLASIGCILSLAEVYDKVDWPTAPAEQ